MRYKKSNLKMKKQVSNMLNVLPSQMQELHDREKVMLEVEGRSEKKKESCPSKPCGVVNEEDGSKTKEVKVDLTEDKHDKKHVVAKFEKPEVNVDPG